MDNATKYNPIPLDESDKTFTRLVCDNLEADFVIEKPLEGVLRRSGGRQNFHQLSFLFGCEHAGA